MVLWKGSKLEGIEVSVIVNEARIISLRLEYVDSSIVMGLWFIYAPPQNADKEEFWKILEDKIVSSCLPAIVVGDFNEIDSLRDKRGGQIPDQTRFRRLRNLKDRAELEDLPLGGNPFTWRQIRKGRETIYERLDRILVSNQIKIWFPEVRTQHHAFSSSDHCKISCELKVIEEQRGRPFKLEKMWMLRKDYESLVRQA